MNTNEIGVAEQHYKKMTQTPVAKLVVLLGIPTTISMLITNLYNLADTYFVGTIGGGVDSSPQGAVGILFTLQSIIQAIAFMLGHGSGSFVAKELANKNADKASKYISSAFFLGGAFGIVFAAIGLIFLTPFMRLLGSTETILPYAKDYGLWVLISCPFLVCSLILNNCLRYEGKAFYAMIGLVSGAVINVGGDYLFINVCNLEVFGAGMSTAISQIISFVILLVLYVKNAQSKISFKHLSRDVKLYLAVCRVGLPSLIRQGLNSISSGALNHLARIYGRRLDVADETIAAMSVVHRCSSFIMCVGMGISQGLQPVASFNYEAKKYARVKRALFITILIGLGTVAAMCVVVFILADKVIWIFNKSQIVIDIGAPALRYATVGLLFVPLFTPVNMMFQSIRKAWTSSLLSLLRNGLTFIPILVLTTSIWGLLGIQISQPLADFLTCLISVPFLIHFLKTTPSKDEPDEQPEQEQRTDL